MRTLILIAVIFFSISANAQRLLPHQKGVELNTGSFLTKGWKSFFINAGLIIHSKKGDYLIFSLEYGLDKVKYKSTKIPIDTYYAEGGYSFMVISNRQKSLMFNLTLSAVAGYEDFNKDNRVLYDGAMLLDESSFIYGAGAKISIETYLSDHLVLLAFAKTRLLWNTSREQFRPSVGLGIRINLKHIEYENNKEYL